MMQAVHFRLSTHPTPTVSWMPFHMTSAQNAHDLKQTMPFAEGSGGRRRRPSKRETPLSEKWMIEWTLTVLLCGYCSVRYSHSGTWHGAMFPLVLLTLEAGSAVYGILWNAKRHAFTYARLLNMASFLLCISAMWWGVPGDPRAVFVSTPIRQGKD